MSDSIRFPVVNQRELTEGHARLTSMAVDLSKNQSVPVEYVSLHLGLYNEAKNDGRKLTVDMTISAAAQLSRHLERTVHRHLYGEDQE